MSESGGQQEVLHVEGRDAELPGGDAERRTRRPPGSSRVRRGRRGARRRLAERAGRRSGRRSQALLRGDQLLLARRARRRAAAKRWRTSATSSKKRGCSRVSAVRGWGRSTSTTPVIRPGRGDITTTRVERKTASEIECVTKTIVLPSRLPDPQQLHVQPLARHLVERAERLVHQQERRARTRARARSRRAAASRPTAARDGGSRSRRARRAEHLLHALGAAAAVPAEHLERQRDVLRDRAPVEEHGVLEDDPVVAVDRAPGAPSCR